VEKASLELVDMAEVSPAFGYGNMFIRGKYAYLAALFIDARRPNLEALRHHLQGGGPTRIGHTLASKAMVCRYG